MVFNEAGSKKGRGLIRPSLCATFRSHPRARCIRNTLYQRLRYVRFTYSNLCADGHIFSPQLRHNTRPSSLIHCFLQPHSEHSESPQVLERLTVGSLASRRACLISRYPLSKARSRRLANGLSLPFTPTLYRHHRHIARTCRRIGQNIGQSTVRLLESYCRRAI